MEDSGIVKGQSGGTNPGGPPRGMSGGRKSGCLRALAARRKYCPSDALCRFCRPWDSHDEDERRRSESQGEGGPPRAGPYFIYPTHASARLAAEREAKEGGIGSGKGSSSAAVAKEESSWNSTKEPGKGQDSVNAIWEVGVKKTEVSIADPGRRGPIDRTREIKELKELPDELWEKVKRPKCGYNFQTEVGVGGTRLMALLDTGSSTNAVGEEVIVGVVNRARSSGLTPGDEAWPVKFERWDDIGGAGGVAVGRTLRIIGAVLLPVMFGGRRDMMVPRSCGSRSSRRGRADGWAA